MTYEEALALIKEKLNQMYPHLGDLFELKVHQMSPDQKYEHAKDWRRIQDKFPDRKWSDKNRTHHLVSLLLDWGKTNARGCVWWEVYFSAERFCSGELDAQDSRARMDKWLTGFPATREELNRLSRSQDPAPETILL